MKGTTTRHRSPAILTAGSENEVVALEYACAYGWFVMPAVGKVPHSRLAPRGLKSASRDPDRIRAWWREEPAANIAVACRPSGLIAIDVDDRHGGHDQLHDLQQDLGELPETPRSLTGGDGLHILAVNPKLRVEGKIATGIDIKDRGYVIAPTSTHRSGRRYHWELSPADVPVAQLPQPWLERLTVNQTERAYRNGGPILRDERNVTLTKIAGAYRRAGASVEAIDAALQITNRERCHPPLEAQEVRKIARSIGKRKTAPAWALDPVAFTYGPGDDLTPIERLVLITLCHRANDEGRVTGGEWLQRETGLSRNSISRATMSLERRERICVLRQKNRSNVYALNDVSQTRAAGIARPRGEKGGSSCTSLVHTEGMGG